ncbi:MAG: RidA family protein [Gemmatimonadaceae bacterium]|nr:RidA family protein [Gemmatimonadaceae bacterium]MCW5826366.1 RidA family protein [Gemmatimonadaceae bacterium]
MTTRASLLLCLTVGLAFGAGLYLSSRSAAPSAAAAGAADLAYLTPFGTPTRPFSPAVRVGDVIFLSGQIGTDPGANASAVVPGGIEAETRQTMDNIKRTVEAVGSSMDKVVKCTVMMADMAEWDRMNAVYREYFSPGRLPARSAFGTSGLALGARVEIECIAAR